MKKNIFATISKIPIIKSPIKWAFKPKFKAFIEVNKAAPDNKLSMKKKFIETIYENKINSSPFKWAFINNLFSTEDADKLSDSYPDDQENFKPIDGYDGEKSYLYTARSMVNMGKRVITNQSNLSPEWQQFMDIFLSKEYARAISDLIGIDVTGAAIEINAFNYNPGSWMGPHVDLKDKIVTHILYFNRNWDMQNGGNFSILNSKETADTIIQISPVIGNSVIVVRSDNSWHSVTKVDEKCIQTRKNITVTFYKKGSVSTMWPPNKK
jgi:Rps23 Pro-64 3,4-dihydroxylase Tpa1-like proline 4-hydroxylase